MWRARGAGCGRGGAEQGERVRHAQSSSQQMQGPPFTSPEQQASTHLRALCVQRRPGNGAIGAQAAHVSIIEVGGLATGAQPRASKEHVRLATS